MNKIYTLVLAFLLFLPKGWSQEFLLHEETFTWTKDADVCGGYHYWSNLGAAPSTNWKVPYDYQYGTYYFRFEVISQPTSDPFKLNMCIWTEYLNGSWKEECMGFSPMLGGNGSSVTYSSPVTYQLNGIHIDWTDLSKLWRMGNPIYVNGHNLGPSIYCTDHPEEWALVNNYFPLKMRITIVAVASGYTFSGWSNYPGGTPPPSKQPTPTYGIEYGFEKTNKVVPSTDEYSASSNMSGAVSGNGQKLTLVPGQDIYFRTKAGGGMLTSDIQHLVVPSRPATPSFSVDYFNETTVETAGSNIGYSLSPSYTNPVNGTGNKIPLTPGQDLYIWTNATASSFASLDQHLVVPYRPGAPSVTLNYAGEITTSLPSSMEFSTNLSMSPATTGQNTGVTVTPGTDLYLRYKASASAFSSSVQTLDVPFRPAAPSITINYENELTTAISSSMEYSANASMSPASTGENSGIPLTPGTNIYIRYKATSGSFSSSLQTLDVPLRPETPAFVIDYIGEVTSPVVTADFQYADNSAMTGAVAGNGTAVTVVPGSSLYIRKTATSGSFRSPVQSLTAPARPVTPSFAIDYLNETTIEVAGSDIEYSKFSDYTEPESGTGNKLALTPAQDLYLWQIATLESFASDVFHLIVPPRPAMPSFSIDFMLEKTKEAVSPEFEYGNQTDLNDGVAGNGNTVAIVPEDTLYFRKLAASVAFKSSIQTLNSLARPSIPEYSIDYTNEKTIEAIPAETEFSVAPDMTNAQPGSGTNLELLPGTDYYFRIKYTLSSYASGIFHLAVPERPEISSAVGDTTEEEFFTATIDFHTDPAGFGVSGVEASNAEVTLMEPQTLKIIPVAPGLVNIHVIPDAILTGNFASDTLKTYFRVIISSVTNPGAIQGSLFVYPSPFSDLLHVQISGGLVLPVEVNLINASGIIVFHMKMVSANEILDLSGVSRGLYVLQATDTKGNVIACKVIRQ